MLQVSSREKIALLLSGIVSSFLIVVFVIVISVNHFRWVSTVTNDMNHEVDELVQEDLIAEEDDDNESEDDHENYYVYDSLQNGKTKGIFNNRDYLLEVMGNKDLTMKLPYNGEPYKTEQMFLIMKQQLPNGGLIYAENITDYYSYEVGLIYTALISIIFSFILSWLVGFWVGGIILRPLKQLMDKVKKAEIGKVPDKIVLSGKEGDEIVELSKILQGMFLKINESYQKVSDFNHNVSHELKNPLAILRSDIELAILKKDTNKLKSSLNDVKYLDEIINKLLFLAHDSKKLVLKDVSIEEIEKIIIDVALNLERYYKAKKDSSYIEIKTTKKLRIDLDLFKELIFNLLENAYKYGIREREIKLIMDNNSIIISNFAEKEPKEDVSRIFEPFYKLDSSRSDKGYGIGLSIVKKICEIFSWEIKVKCVKKEIIFEIKW